MLCTQLIGMMTYHKLIIQAGVCWRLNLDANHIRHTSLRPEARMPAEMGANPPASHVATPSIAGVLAQRLLQYRNQWAPNVRFAKHTSEVRPDVLSNRYPSCTFTGSIVPAPARDGPRTNSAIGAFRLNSPERASLCNSKKLLSRPEI